MKKRLNAALDALKFFGTLALAQYALAALFYVGSNGNLNNPIVGQNVLAAAVTTVFTAVIVTIEFFKAK